MGDLTFTCGMYDIGSDERWHPLPMIGFPSRFEIPGTEVFFESSNILAQKATLHQINAARRLKVTWSDGERATPKLSVAAQGGLVDALFDSGLFMGRSRSSIGKSNPAGYVARPFGALCKHVGGLCKTG